MTKRELIDQILSENHTAEPSFLAQFSDEQLREYLAHLKWIRQPRLSGNPARFDKYFRNADSAPAAAAAERWTHAIHHPQDELGQPTVNDNAATDEPVSQDLSIQMPDDATFEELVLPPVEQFHVDEALSEEESLESTQVTPREREQLREKSEPSDQTDRQQTGQPPFADNDPDAQPWLF